MLTRTDIETLAGQDTGLCFSLFVPTARSGARTQKAAIHLKNVLAEAERLGAAHDGATTKDVRELLEPARALVEDEDFWNQQREGLGLFVANGTWVKHRLPHSVPALAYVGERFCVRPLLPALSNEDRFYVLALSQGAVRLFECTRSTEREVDLAGMPTQLEDVVGYDYEEKTLQHHTSSKSAGARPAANFHGHGRAKDKDEEELKRFLHAVDDGLLERITDRNAPLVIAAVEHVAVLFRELTAHTNVLDSGLTGSPDTARPEELHAEALEFVLPHLESRRRAAVETVEGAVSTGKAVTQLADALGLLHEGRVSTLLVRESGPVWGREAGGAVETHEQREDGDDDLLDLAVHRALATGAEVHAVPDSDLPDAALLAAFLRY